MIVITQRTGRGKNNREHHMARHRRVKSEREQTGWMLKTARRPALPCMVTLTRTAPSRGLDDDNLVESLAGVRDEVAAWLGIDDRDARVQWRYAQRRGAQRVWQVWVEFMR